MKYMFAWLLGVPGFVTVQVVEVFFKSEGQGWAVRYERTAWAI